MRKALMAMLLVVSAALSAQKPVLSPLPQKIVWGEEITDASALPRVIGTRGDEAVAAYESLIPQTKDGYYLKIAPDGIVIAGNDERGTFYGEKTLLQLFGQDRTNAGHDTKVYAAEITDYPMVPDRGVVEGFYGNPWSHADRLHMFDFLADNKMNMYIYGPKDDPWHWGKWSELYPTDELNRLKELVQYAAKVKVKFVWAVHTGQSLTEEQYTLLNKKFEQLYKIGVRNFGMFYDDAYGVGATQAAILNRMTEEFIKTHEGCEPFICCPAVYCDTFYGMGDANSLPDMCSKTRDADVRIMWTGSGVMDMQLGNSVQGFINKYSVKPFIWHNWPVNDYSRTHLFMGKSDGMDANLYKKICGFTANPMEFAEASKVVCYSIADYLWNMSAYNADKSWQQAWQHLYPAHATEFGLFCQNSVNPGSNRISRPGESKYFLEALNKGVTEGELYKQIYDASVALLADDYDEALAAEMAPWFRAMQYTGKRGMLLDTLRLALEEKDPEAFIEAYKQAKALEEALKNNQSHTMYGGQGYIVPTYGTLVISPRIAKSLASLASQFKQAGYDYPKDLFTAQVIEDGNYYIIYQGKYLTNKGDNPTKTGDRPTWVAELDDIKPARQQWHIEIDGETMRYKITSVADDRYINENGTFWASATTNPYEAAWHTYNIYRRNGLHAIQNAGSAGDKFWTVSGSNVTKGTSNVITGSNFIFEIVPVDGAIEHPTVEGGKRYYIAYGNELLSDMTSAQYPYFRASFAKNTQMFVFTKETAKDGRFKIESGKSGSSHSYINEKGEFGTNQYYADWNSYNLIARDGLWAIQNAESAGTKFWTVTKDASGNSRITIGGSEPEYLFEIGSDWEAFKDRVTAVESVRQDNPANTGIYNINGQRVARPSQGIYIIDGKKAVLKE